MSESILQLSYNTKPVTDDPVSKLPTCGINSAPPGAPTCTDIAKCRNGNEGFYRYCCDTGKRDQWGSYLCDAPKNPSANPPTCPPGQRACNPRAPS